MMLHGRGNTAGTRTCRNSFKVQWFLFDWNSSYAACPMRATKDRGFERFILLLTLSWARYAFRGLWQRPRLFGWQVWIIWLHSFLFYSLIAISFAALSRITSPNQSTRLSIKTNGLAVSSTSTNSLSRSRIIQLWRGLQTHRTADLILTVLLPPDWGTSRAQVNWVYQSKLRNRVGGTLTHILIGVPTLEHRGRIYHALMHHNNTKQARPTCSYIKNNNQASIVRVYTTLQSVAAVLCHLIHT